MIYIDQNAKCKVKERLNLYKYILRNNQKQPKNVPVVVIQEVTNDFILPLIEKPLTEEKEVILTGDYNINIPHLAFQLHLEH